MVAKKEVRRVVDSLTAQGLTVHRTSKQRYRVFLDGEWITTLPGNPKDHRSLENSLRPLKRLGYRV